MRVKAVLSIPVGKPSITPTNGQIRGGAASTWKRGTLLQSLEKLLREEEKAEERSPCLWNREKNRTKSGDPDRKSPNVKATPSSRRIYRVLEIAAGRASGTVRCSEAERDAD
jgi:hypothetical protein